MRLITEQSRVATSFLANNPTNPISPTNSNNPSSPRLKTRFQDALREASSLWVIFITLITLMILTLTTFICRLLSR